MSVFSSSYVRIENAKLDPLMERIYQPNLPVASGDMFSCFLLDEDPKQLVTQTPHNHITFHLRVPILTLAAAQIAYDRSIVLKYKMPDVNWHLNSLNPHYSKQLQLWVQWTLKSNENYMWMRDTLLYFVEELKNIKAYSDDNEGVVSSMALLADKEGIVSSMEHAHLTKFPTSVRTSRAKLVANRWMYAQFYKNAVPEWWPYPKTLFTQELVNHIDKVKLKLLRDNEILVLDQAPDIAFAPPPAYLIKDRKKTWEAYDWRGFKKFKGNWHKLYNYDRNWLQRWIR